MKEGNRFTGKRFRILGISEMARQILSQEDVHQLESDIAKCDSVGEELKGGYIQIGSGYTIRTFLILKEIKEGKFTGRKFKILGIKREILDFWDESSIELLESDIEGCHYIGRELVDEKIQLQMGAIDKQVLRLKEIKEEEASAYLNSVKGEKRYICPLEVIEEAEKIINQE